MTQVHAWQHIYTSVEREQSPHNRGGFQTLFYSRSGLTEAEVQEMEARLVYFPEEKKEAVKHVFATISTGKIMVAQIVHLMEPDRLGRRGRYLAHNLVFDPRVFAQIEADPFVVFRQFPFVTTVTEALERGDLQTGDIPPASFEITPEPAREIEVVENWPTQTLDALTLLALRAKRLAGDRLGLAFVGEPCSVLNALQAAFFAVPASLRLHCSFDTYFHHCNPVSAYYWAVGLLEPPVSRRLITVNTRSRQLEGIAAGQPETAYERWAIALIEGRRQETISRYRGHAFAVCEWLEGRACPDRLVNSVPFEVVDSVFQPNRELVRTLLYSKLEEVLPPVLARRVYRYLSRQAWDARFAEQIMTRFCFSELSEALYRAYESEGFRAPHEEEVQAIDWLLRRADHAFLRLLYICWTGQRDALYVELQLLNEDEYRQFVQTALRFGLTEPWALLVPSKGDAFLDVYLALGGPAECNLVTLVQALLGVGETSCLSRLIPYVHVQSEQDLRILAKIVAQRPGIPAPFQHAVAGAIEALPPRRPGFSAWFGWGRTG